MSHVARYSPAFRISQLDAFRVAPVEFAFHECRDVDVVDDEIADKPGQADVNEP